MNTKIKIILLVLLIPIFIYFWPLALGGDSEFLVVQGISMLPTITDGSLVITKKVSPYQIDDIVSFSLKESGFQRIVVHRIIGETEEGFIVKGDNNKKKDPGYATEKDIRGKVLFATPYFGEALKYLRNPIVFIMATIVTLGIQAEQRRRKKRNEKLRRIRLGYTPKSEKLIQQVKKKKTTKPDYSLFYVAIAFNVLIFILTQISIVEKWMPVRHMGDDVTGFLFRMFDSSFASTVSFAIYFVFIFGFYFLAKYYEAKMAKSKTSSRKKSGYMVQLVRKNLNPMLMGAQVLWLLFIFMSLFQLITIGGDILKSVTAPPCDPTQAICK